MPRKRTALAAAVVGALTWAVAPATASADGTEQLGELSVPLAEATGVVVAATGLFTQPGTLSVELPEDAAVLQALLYLESGHRGAGLPDGEVEVNGATVTGELIGGPTAFYGDVSTATHRADITDLGLVGPGTSTLEVDGLDGGDVADGAALVVLYQQPGVEADVQLVDGNDIAFVDFASPLDTTVPQTFAFEAAPVDRTAELSLAAGSVHDPVEALGQYGHPAHRPHALRYSTAGVTTTVADVFPDDGVPEMDAATVEVLVPAGATSLSVQLLSERDGTGDLPASLVWVVAALALPEAAPPVTVPPTAPPPTAPPLAAEVAAPPPTAEVAAAVVTAPPTTVAVEVLDANAQLPRTGADAGSLAWVALVLAAAGAGFVALGRRRWGGAG